MKGDDLFTIITGLGVIVVAAIGITREGFGAAQNASAMNDSEFAASQAGQLEAFAGGLTELLPLLMLVGAAAVILKVVR
jgi:hypothetical protein